MGRGGGRLGGSIINNTDLLQGDETGLVLGGTNGEKEDLEVGGNSGDKGDLELVNEGDLELILSHSLIITMGFELSTLT